VKRPILRHLKSVAGPFIKATDVDQVLETLDAAVCPVMKVHAVIHNASHGIPYQFYHPGTPGNFRADVATLLARHGPTVTARYAALNPLPFTFTEVRRRLQPTGKDRWIFDLCHDHGIRDGVYCSFWPWAVIYKSDHVLKGSEVSEEVRTALEVSATMATSRLKEITGHAAPAAPVRLTPCEMAVLQYLSDGVSVIDIADRLALSETSVKTFVRRATKKLNATSQLHAVAIAVRSRLI
jgi:DNA-binding CsgD family transcriptional regulator